MFLLLTFVFSLVGLLALFWGGSLLAQGYLYNTPAPRLGVRAAVAALVMALFLTGWVWLDQQTPGRYDTLFDFSQYDIQEYEQFKAIQKNVAGKEQTVVYRRATPPAQVGPASLVYLDPSGRKFVKNTADAMVVAVVVEDEGESVRFDATLDEKGRFTEPRRYQEVGGDRYMELESPGRVFDPRLGVLLANLLLNFVHFLLWFVLLWLVLQFSWGHALGLAFAIWLAVILVLLPVLFQQN